MTCGQRFRRTMAVMAMALLFAFSSAQAHESRPAYLEIRETAPGTFSVLWRTPVLSGRRLPVALKLPDTVKNLKEPITQELADSLVERRSIIAGPNGLAGARIEFPGLQLTITDVLIRVSSCWTARNGRPSCIPRNRGWKWPRRKPHGE